MYQLYVSKFKLDYISLVIVLYCPAIDCRRRVQAGCVSAPHTTIVLRSALSVCDVQNTTPFSPWLFPLVSLFLLWLGSFLSRLRLLFLLTCLSYP